MKNYLKTALLIISLGITTSLFSQVRLPVTNNDLRNNLEKVVSDFPFDFSSLKGDTLLNDPQTIAFYSKLDFKSALDNTIFQYKSARPVYSWTATLLNTEDFDEAAKKYAWLYNQLKVMTLTFQGGISYTLSGKVEAPSMSKKFNTSIFLLTSHTRDLPKVKIEASLNFEFPEWKVKLMVYEKEREDSERGNITGE